MNSRVLAALAASVLGLAGCSSSSSANQKVPATFATQVAQVCASNLARYPTIGSFPYSNFNPHDPSASQLPAVGAYFAGNQRSIQPFESALTALGEPSTDANSWNNVKTLVVSFYGNAIAQKNAALASNVSAFVSLVKQNQTLTNQLKAAATRAGISVTGPCANEF